MSNAPSTLTTADELRQHLDDLNEAGTTPTAVGIDALGRPFLITLYGPYADTEHVLFDSPWQGDVSYGERVNGEWVPKKPWCEDCDGMVHATSDLAFPVVVLRG